MVVHAGNVEPLMEDETCISASTPLEMRAKARASREVDRQSEDSFPASDPRSYCGGSIAGAPQRD